MSQGDSSSLSLIKVSQIVRTDYQDLRSLFQANNIADIRLNFHPFPLSDESALRIASEPTKDLYYLARWTGEPVGFGMLRGWDEGYEVPSFGVFVDVRHQGKGVGRRIAEFCISEGGRRRCSSIRLTVLKANERAYTLYRSLGFVEVVDDYSRREEVPSASVVMQKWLPQ